MAVDMVDPSTAIAPHVLRRALRRDAPSCISVTWSDAFDFVRQVRREDHGAAVLFGEVPDAAQDSNRIEAEDAHRTPSARLIGS